MFISVPLEYQLLLKNAGILRVSRVQLRRNDKITYLDAYMFPFRQKEIGEELYALSFSISTETWKQCVLE